ncbi:hypothetical protein KIN20_020418 [Parelaphostrongylus tenuis]|uniref:Uncharacterized protein n=1 Tax=Parelaphostrongylus tenuis TaxID=148309 RepID=A0AAD5N6I3_PARTN|nr:hypothetical protein KIN20_020418 [Parelaphostrongylus tenuis]
MSNRLWNTIRIRLKLWYEVTFCGKAIRQSWNGNEVGPQELGQRTVQKKGGVRGEGARPKDGSIQKNGLFCDEQNMKDKIDELPDEFTVPSTNTIAINHKCLPSD